MNNPSPAWTALLHARRSYFNARFAEKQSAHPDLNGDDFAEILRTLIVPVVEFTAPYSPDSARVVGQTL